MCRNRKHNRADFPFLKSVCKASSQLPLLLFSHCFLSKKSLSNACVCMRGFVRSCPLFHHRGLKYSLTHFVLLSLPLLYLCTVMLKSLPTSSNFSPYIFSHFSYLKISPLYPHSCLPVSSSTRLHWSLPNSFWILESVISQECVPLHIWKMTHSVCISPVSRRTKRDQVQCLVQRQVSDLRPSRSQDDPCVRQVTPKHSSVFRNSGVGDWISNAVQSSNKHFGSSIPTPFL